MPSWSPQVLCRHLLLRFDRRGWLFHLLAQTTRQFQARLKEVHLEYSRETAWARFGTELTVAHRRLCPTAISLLGADRVPPGICNRHAMLCGRPSMATAGATSSIKWSQWQCRRLFTLPPVSYFCGGPCDAGHEQCGHRRRPGSSRSFGVQLAKHCSQQWLSSGGASGEQHWKQQYQCSRSRDRNRFRSHANGSRW